MLEVIPLSSGSQGNATLVRSKATALLIDAGLTRKEMLVRLEKAGQDPGTITGLLLTHRHKDHCRAAATLCRRFKIPLHATARTAEHQQPRTLPEIREFDPSGRFEIGDLEIEALTLSHDAPETQAFVIEHGSEGHRVGIATDLGCSTGGVSDFLQDLDALLLEFNYDPAMLHDGPYPAFLKQRIDSALGHLSNEQSATLLNQVAGPRLETIYLCHLSQHNNSPALALEAAGSILAGHPTSQTEVRVALQDKVSEGKQLG
jgi:phosphoribosyl 1,2-cyclic phosphodiesterase